MRFLPVNLGALLVELDDLPQTLALLDSLQAEPIEGVDEIVPGARTLLLTFSPATVQPDALRMRLSARPLHVRRASGGERIEIPVRYVGDDLAEVARLLGVSAAEVVRRHTECDYTVAFTGFTPGFAYLNGSAGLNVPRRATPRTRVPAGAVALAGDFSGVYPQAGPGGWQIIGSTSASMWDLGRSPPALLRPGQRVRFVDESAFPQRIEVAATSAPVHAPQMPIAASAAALQVRRGGQQATFQDLGRRGQRHQGVSPSGAMDRAALRRANRLVGNPQGAPVLEVVYGGFELECHGDAVVAVAGAGGPLTLHAGHGKSWPVQREQAVALTDRDRLFLGAPARGIRAYVAVRGGFAVEPVLGSCSFDSLARIGPPPLADGQRLAILAPRVGGVVGVPEIAPELPSLQEPVVLDVVMGPRTDWFTDETVERLFQQAWVVTPQSNRVGLRLAGDLPLARVADRVGAELPSEGTSAGALQVPPDGQPVLFMADHPVTGGYPVIGSVAAYHLDRAGQVPIGASLRFRPVAAFDPKVLQRSPTESSMP